MSALVNLFRGTPKFDSIIGLSTCEPLSFGILAIFVVTCIVLTVFNVRSIFGQLALKRKYEMLHKSEEWMVSKNLTFMLVAAFFSGMFGQLFGLGGGFIYGPMLLSIGVNPLVSGSTLLYMILYTNSISCFMFFIFGQVDVPYTLWLCIFTGSGVILGLCLIKRAMENYKRPSLLVIALAVAIVISTIVSLYSSVKSIKSQIENDVNVYKGDPIC